MKRVIRSSYGALESKSPSFKAGYDKAMELLNYGTFMTDESNMIYKLSKRDPDYATADDDYRTGFMEAVYKMRVF